MILAQAQRVCNRSLDSCATGSAPLRPCRRGTGRSRVSYRVVGHTDAEAEERFVFSTIGQLATIGRRTGVANILGVNFSGFVVWWLWRTIYLSKLPGFEKKQRVAFDWTLDLIFPRDLVQFLNIEAPMISRPEVDRTGPGA